VLVTRIVVILIGLVGLAELISPRLLRSRQRYEQLTNTREPRPLGLSPVTLARLVGAVVVGLAVLTLHITGLF
jgi:hypothetical protein